MARHAIADLWYTASGPNVPTSCITGRCRSVNYQLHTPAGDQPSRSINRSALLAPDTEPNGGDMTKQVHDLRREIISMHSEAILAGWIAGAMASPASLATGRSR